MNLSETLFNAFNQQTARELFNADTYRQIVSQAEFNTWEGFAKKFSSDVTEELEHTEAFRDYMVKRNRTPATPIRAEIKCDCKEPVEFVATALALEQENTKSISNLFSLCRAEKDYDAERFLDKYLEIQLDSEHELSNLLMELRRAGSNAAVLLIDQRFRK